MTRNFFNGLAGIVLAAAALLSSGAQAGITYYHNDLLGSPAVATNATGQVIWRESYRPYGERLTKAPASAANDVWFTSRRQDAETGLVYMGARYYDPVLGHFISKDPVGFEEGNLHSFSRYAYANNNPYRYVDPDGRNPVLIAMGIGALIGGGINAASQYLSSGSIKWQGIGGVIDAAGDGMLLGLAGARASPASSAQTTAHGAQRIAGEGATRGGVLGRDAIQAVREGGRTLTQADGATVRVLESEGRYSVVVEGERGIITTFKNLSQKSLDKLSKNYGWKE